MVDRDTLFDRTLAVAFLIACEVELLVNVAHHGASLGAPVGVDAALLAAVTIPAVVRRREPEAMTVVSFACLMVLALVFARWKDLVLPQLVLFVMPYAVGAYGRRVRPTVGLAVCVVCPLLIGAVTGASGAWFVVGACVSSWALGRYVRSNRALTSRLQATAVQIAAEREDRERLVVAEQRSLIARELQTVVAERVSTMTVQARAARQLLETGSGEADDALATIERTGRETMNELRRLLGVLRRADAQPDLAPQPGVGQIPKLVEKARAQRHVALRVEGDPAALPASADLGLYRIVEDLLRAGADLPVEIALTFGVDDVELRMSAPCGPGTEWPSVATRERVALCEGQLSVTSEAGTTALVVRLPRVLEGVFP